MITNTAPRPYHIENHCNGDQKRKLSVADEVALLKRGVNVVFVVGEKIVDKLKGKFLKFFGVIL